MSASLTASRSAFLVALLAALGCRSGARTVEPDDARAAPLSAPATEAGAAPSASASSLAPAPPLSPARAAALADDVRARVDAASRAVPRSRVRVAGDLFVLVTSDPNVPLDRAASLTQATTGALFAGPLQHRPDRAVTVFLFATQAAFDGALRARSVKPVAGEFGVYHRATREVFVSLAAGPVESVAHEVAHPLLEADFPLSPAWLAEGIASLFERPDFAVPGEIHGKAHFRLQTLRTALASPRDRGLVRLGALFGMSDEAFRSEPAWLEYAVAREAMRWLDSEKHALWRFYAAWRDGVLDDATGEKAFAAAMGETPAEAQGEWVDWIESERAED